MEMSLGPGQQVQLDDGVTVGGDRSWDVEGDGVLDRVLEALSWTRASPPPRVLALRLHHAHGEAGTISSR